jgi:parallel beta-helix repeat protein
MNSKLRFHGSWLKLLCLVACGLWLVACGLLYAQDDYLEARGDTRVDTLTFSTFSGDNSWTFPNTPVIGEVFYNFNPTRKRPYYYDGTPPNLWEEFTGGSTGGDRYVASRIVAASDSLSTTCGGGTCTNLKADYTCDGTDDQQEINKAINALPVSGGAVYLLEGTYNISTALLEGEPRPGIHPHTNTAIIGTGAGTVLRLVLNPPTFINVIEAVNVNNILISQLRIDGNNRTGSSTTDGIDFSTVTNSKIDNVWIDNIKWMGIYLMYSTNNIISGNNFQGNGLNGIYFAASSNNIISGNNFQANLNAGIYVDAESPTNILLGNNIQGNGYDGILLDSQGLRNTKNNIIYGNNIQGNSYMGIRFLRTSNNIILGNNIQANKRQAAITLYDDCSSNIISGNNIQGNAEEGIEIAGGSSLTSANNIISGNSIFDNGTVDASASGILLDDGANNNLISSNLLSDSSGTGNPINIGWGINNDNYLVGNLISNWPAGCNRINDNGVNTQYTDKIKMTLERRQIDIDESPYTLDVTTDGNSWEDKFLTSYAALNPTGNVTLSLTKGSVAGELLILENITASTVTINEPVGGNVNLGVPAGGSRILHQYDVLKLIWNGSRWLELYWGNNTPP